MTALPPEQELHLLRQQQEALLRAIAHDLPAPLRHIQSFAPLLVEAVQTLAAAAPHAADAAAEALECAQFMQQGAQRMGQMLQALAELSRAARMPLHLQAVDVVATCQALLPALQQQYPVIGDVRGLGLMIGTEFRGPDRKPDKPTAKALARACHQRGLMLLTCGPWDNVIRWIPPLVVTEAQVDKALEIFADSLREVIG